MKVKGFKRIACAVLCAALLIGQFAGIPMTAGAVTVSDTHNGIGTKIADAATVNGWQELFVSDNTGHAGGVWTDKSVFVSAADYISATAEAETGDAQEKLAIDPDNFLVSLSTMASTKSIVGYTNTPTDTMLVLDMSSSMIYNRSIDELAKAANAAVRELLALNNHNRVGVVLYAGNTAGNFTTNAVGTTMVLMPLDRYTASTDVDGDGLYDYLYYTKSGNTSDWNNIYIVDGVKNSSNATVDGSKNTSSGTFIQDGIYVAMNQFLRSDIETVIPSGQIQAGTERMPIMVLMTDGEPTLAQTDFDGNNGALGPNNMDFMSHGYHDITFLSQLTASYAKQQIDNKYGPGVLFYTLGLNVDENEALVMDPAMPGADQNLLDRFDGYWEALKNNGRADLIDSAQTGRPGRPTTYSRTVTYDTAAIAALEAYRYYADAYFPAADENSLIGAFEEIVEQIIIQSLYYPTLVESGQVHGDGYLTFIDYIGENMEIKSVKGLQLGNTVFDGSKLARFIVTGSAGTEQDPTELGNDLIWALTDRLGLTRGTDTQIVRNLVLQAYNAGQISYNASTGEFSNYVGWYGDINGKFLGFWDGKEPYTNVPSGAVAANKSYLFLDAVGAGHRETDILYASIQVSTTIVDYTSGRGSEQKAGTSMFYARIPASLIPLVQYEIILNSTDVTDVESLTVTGATAPGRLLYEVGVKSSIDLLDMASSGLTPNANGEYIFYTNSWTDGWNGSNIESQQVWTDNAYAMFEPSQENEHYYYHEDTLLYSDTNGTPLTSDPGNSSCYHRYLVYKLGAGGNATYEYEYQPVSEEVRSDADNFGVSSSGQYYVKKGVIYRYTAEHVHTKLANETGTADYASYPYVHHTDAASSDGEYHIDDILGNNGKLVLVPYEGLKITKVVDSTLSGTDTYSFDIVCTENNFSGAVTLVLQEADGTRTYSQTAFANGSLSVSLKPGQTVYVVGQAMTGKTFTVSEQIVTGEFKVSGVVVSNGTDADLDPDTATVAVADGLITGVQFTNTKVVTGDVAIAKTVISDIASHKTTMNFTFEVTLDAPAGIGLKNSYPAELVATTDTGVSVAYGTVSVNTLTGKVTGFTANGATSDIVLQHTDYLLIRGLEEGITVKVTETDLPTGFSITSVSDDDADTSASETKGNATIEVGQTKVIHFTNTYSAAPTDETDFNINITKDLIDASTWDGDFNFKIQRLNVTTGEYMDVSGAVGSVDKAAGDTLTDEDGDGQTDDWTETTVIIREHITYDAAGTYSYRIVEVIPDSPDPAIAYDPVMAYFTVTVTDPGNGKLIVSDVTAGTDAVVGTPEKNNAGHITEVTVGTSFVNTYVVDGAAEAVIHIDKIINSTDSQATIRPEGFVFDLYSATVADGVWTAGQKVKENIVTDLAGDAVVNLVYTGANQNGTYHYILKEQAGSNPNVSYSTQEYHITVVVSEVGGKYAISVEVTDADGNAVGSDSVAPAVAPATPVVTADEDSYTVTAEEGADLYIAADGGGWFKASGNTYTAGLFEPMFDVTAFAVKNGLFSQQISVMGHVMGTDVDLHQNTFDISVEPSYLQSADDETGMHQLELVNYHPLGRLGLLEYYYKTSEDGSWVPYTGAIDLTDRATRPNEIYAYAQFGTVQSEQITYVKIAYNDSVPTSDLAYADVHRTYINNPNYSDPGSTEIGIAKAEITSGVTFTNKFTPDPVSLTIPVSGTKVITGWPADVTAPDFTFELYKADNSWNLLDADATADGVNPMYAQTVSGAALADGIEGFVFNVDGTDKPFTTSGYYYSVMKERIPAEATAANNYTVNGITYDPTEYRIIAQVTGDSSTGKLTATIISVTTASGDESVAVFNNTYRAEPAPASINGNKTLNSALWTLNPNTFSFALYETDDTYTVGQTPIQTVTNGIGADIGAFRFDLSFDTAGDYYYVVKEVVPAGVDASNPTKNGITFDTTEYKVKVTVADNGTGALTAVADIIDDADDVAAFTNSYSVTGTYSTITGVKNLDGAILSGNYDAQTSFADLFEFELYSASVTDGAWTEGALLGTTNPDDAGSFSFTVGEFTRPGNHYYIIKEKVTSSDALIEYDPAVYHVTVNVVDNLDGTLVSYWSAVKKGYTGIYDTSAPITFHNVVAPVKVAIADLGGSKVFSGWSGATNPTFTFGMYASNENGEKLDGDPNVDGVNPLLTADVAGSGNFTFADVADSNPSDHVDDGTHYLTFSTADTRYYLITEEIPSDAVNNEKDGITYSPARYLVKIEVTMTEAAAQGPVRDTLNATVTYYSLNEQGVKTEIQKANVIFSNDYATTPDGQIHLGGSKTMVGATLEDGDYTFNLFTATFDTTTNTVQASQIRKSQASNVGTAFAFDGFTVTTAGDHYFVIEENIPSGAVEITTGTMAGKWLKDGIYYDATRYVAKVTATDTGTGKLTFSQPEYFLLNADGTIGSAATAAFVNTYLAEPVNIPADVQIQGQKTLAGGPDIEDGDFTFKMYLADDAWNKAQGEPLTAEVKADGTFVFVNTNGANENFVATAAGTYNFIIEEVAGTDTRVTYDTNKYYVTYTVKDDGRGKLYVDETLTVIKKVVIENSTPVLSDATSVTFLNTYDPLATSFTVDGQKVLLDYAGQETSLNGRKFRFSIYSANAVFQVADDAQPIETVENNGDGEFSFEVPLTTAGNHYFVVMEEAGTEEGMTYDATRYEIRVQVSNVQGQLQVDHVALMSNDQIASEMVFTNTYAPAPDPDDITVSLTVEKILENKDAYTGTLEGFKFELTDANGNVLATRTTDASGKALFQITYPGYEFAGYTYTYYIREVNTGIENIVYSTKQYKVEVTVGYNRADDVLTASVKKDGQALQSGETFAFTNVYNAPKPSNPVPPTGDHTTILYMAIFAASIFGFVVTAMMSLRRKRRG